MPTWKSQLQNVYWCYGTAYGPATTVYTECDGVIGYRGVTLIGKWLCHLISKEWRWLLLAKWLPVLLSSEFAASNFRRHFANKQLLCNLYHSSTRVWGGGSSSTLRRQCVLWFVLFISYINTNCTCWAPPSFFIAINYLISLISRTHRMVAWLKCV